MCVLSLISSFIWPRGGEQPQSAGTSDSVTGAAASGSGARPNVRGITPAHLGLTAILLGLSWGVIGQALRDLRLVSDLALMFLSLVVVLGLCLSAILRYKLRWPERGPGRVGGSAIPLRAGALAALFLTSAVTSHYMYYIATLALGLGQQGASPWASRAHTRRCGSFSRPLSSGGCCLRREAASALVGSWAGCREHLAGCDSLAAAATARTEEGLREAGA
jgi:hypothetical protein